ncbi:MAG TPA: hypothetical protein VEF34_17985 [Syntrophobacteraceae bacterium]|nr:hypothetical protein [Syntrophobacteraceae bacterium]
MLLPLLRKSCTSGMFERCLINTNDIVSVEPHIEPREEDKVPWKKGYMKEGSKSVVHVRNCSEPIYTAETIEEIFSMEQRYK